MNISSYSKWEFFIKKLLELGYLNLNLLLIEHYSKIIFNVAWNFLSYIQNYE